MMSVKFAVVHFNNGMHGWEYSEAEYAAGLPAMITAFKAGAPKAKLIWATKTPVRKDPTPAGATNGRIDERNRLAKGLMSKDAIPVDDQHALIEPYSDLQSDDVHFKPEGSAIQAT